MGFWVYNMTLWEEDQDIPYDEMDLHTLQVLNITLYNAKLSYVAYMNIDQSSIVFKSIINAPKIMNKIYM
jgi:hypothetical protein